MLLTLIYTALAAALAVDHVQRPPATDLKGMDDRDLNVLTFHELSREAYAVLTQLLRQQDDTNLSRVIASVDPKLLAQVYASAPASEMLSRHQYRTVDAFVAEFNTADRVHQERMAASKWNRNLYREANQRGLLQWKEDPRTAERMERHLFGKRQAKEWNETASEESRKGLNNLTRARTWEEFDDIMRALSPQARGQIRGSSFAVAIAKRHVRTLPPRSEKDMPGPAVKRHLSPAREYGPRTTKQIWSESGVVPVPERAPIGAEEEQE